MNLRIVEINDIKEAVSQMMIIGCDPYSVSYMAKKSINRTIVLNEIDNRAANLIKQTMLSIGGEAAVSKDVSNFVKGKSSVVIMGTLHHYGKFADKLSNQPFGLQEIGRKIKLALLNYNKPYSKPCVMGILNVTPDSFSDGGKHNDIDKAVSYSLDMEKAGADIIDVGGESTRPGSKPVSLNEELARVIPVIKRLKSFLKIPISIDTYKPEVADAAIKSGAGIVNDITGLRYNNGLMADVVSRYKKKIIIMHMLGKPKTMNKSPKYKDVVSDIGDFFSSQIEFAVRKGIKPEKIILDPGIGFGKTPDHSIEILKRIKEFKVFGLPIAIGTSRKSFIGHLLGGVGVDERSSGSIASAVWAAINGVQILRVHDVPATVQALKVVGLSSLFQ